MPFPTPFPPGPSPLAALASYHECLGELLSHLGDLLAEGVRKPGEREAVARDILVGFDCALHVHLDDEEDDVFPAILAAAESPGRRAQAFELVSSLLVEHREMAELWLGLRVALGAIGHGIAVPFPEYTARRFLDLCHRHLEREERELGDLVRGIPPARLAQVTESIARRHAALPECCPHRTRKT
jgi:hypothetical protein